MTDKKSQPLAIITGGSGYLGAAVTAQLIRRGWHVASLSRKATPDSTGENIICDITDESAVRDVIEKLVTAHGPIHACIHAAASPLERVPMLSLTWEKFVMPVSVALDGAFALAKAAVPHMPQGSVFIGITSEAAEVGVKTAKTGSYVPAKYALRGFLRVLAEELASKKIRVNAVAPDFLPGGLNGDLPEAMRGFLAQKSGITLEDVSTLIADLCTGTSEFPAGTSIRPGSKGASPL